MSLQKTHYVVVLCVEEDTTLPFTSSSVTTMTLEEDDEEELSKLQKETGHWFGFVESLSNLID